jgi:hypothetical protein
MATATTEPITNGTATPPIADDSTTASSGTKRKRADSENVPQIDGVIDGVVTNSVLGQSNPQLQDSLKDILKVLRQ